MSRILIESLRALEIDGKLTDDRLRELDLHFQTDDYYIKDLIVKIIITASDELYHTPFCIDACAVELLELCGYVVFINERSVVTINTRKGSIEVPWAIPIAR